LQICTAVLIPARNEDIEGLGARIRALSADLRRQGIAEKVDLFLLSDSDDPVKIGLEERLALSLSAEGRPIEFVQSVYRGDRFTMRVRLAPGSTDA